MLNILYEKLAASVFDTVFDNREEVQSKSNDTKIVREAGKQTVGPNYHTHKIKVEGCLLYDLFSRSIDGKLPLDVIDYVQKEQVPTRGCRDD
ncbi:hypothetical protein MP228_000357 [Amoeboaphelidium protococcarum]|nr:hypothetical protein MP228_000357 [Amoeboaphelidium protococcarum]